jgi:L,D-peptidoglycan transpeptidase YkuD (ErfK/YbiS/YcfS/YnhG family)
MRDRERVRLRRTETSDQANRRVVLAASGLAVIALVVGVGALIQGTFPRVPDPAASSASALATVTAPDTLQATAPSQPQTQTLAEIPTATVVEAQPKSEPAPAKPAEPVPPLGMKRTIEGSRQMIVATGAKLGSKNGQVRIYNLENGQWTLVFSTPCRFGSNGLINGEKRAEGSRTTPTGIWRPGNWVWGWHKEAPSGTKMPYRQTTEKVWWSCARDSTYNTWVESSKRISGEHLVDVRIQYEYAFSTGYNSPPNQVVKGRGTAIFLHVFDPPWYHGGYSAGCIGISRSAMIRVFRTLDPTLKPSFIIGTEEHGTSTSIEAY